MQISGFSLPYADTSLRIIFDSLGATSRVSTSVMWPRRRLYYFGMGNAKNHQTSSI